MKKTKTTPKKKLSIEQQNDLMKETLMHLHEALVGVCSHKILQGAIRNVLNEVK